MSITYERTVVRALPAAALLLAGTLLTACSGASSAASESSPSAGSPFDQAIDYAKCMRANGVPEFPDPKQEDGGIRMEAGGADRDSEEFRSAEKACRDKAPQGRGGENGGEDLDPAKVAAWAKCVREHGLPEFPDPEIDGGNMAIKLQGTGISPDDAAFQKARKACQDKWPGGGVMMRGGGDR